MSHPGTEAPDADAAAWREYRRRRRWAFGAAFAMAPVAAVMLAAGGRPRLEPAALALAAIGLIAAAVAGWRFGLWPCPRCGRPFALPSVREWVLATPGTQIRMLATKRCWHCGLPKWAPAAPESSPDPVAAPRAEIDS